MTTIQTPACYLLTDHTVLFRQLRAIEGNLGGAAEETADLPVVSSSGGFLLALPCQEGAQPGRARATLPCALCRRPISVRVRGNDEEEEEEEEDAEGSMSGRAERAQMCLDCYAGYAQSQLVVRLHAEITASVSSIGRTLRTLERLVAALSSSEIVDFGADFLAAVDLHANCEQAVEAAQRALRHYRQLAPRSPSEAALLANIQQTLAARLRGAESRFRVVSCEVRRLRLLQAEQLYLRFVAFSSELRLNAGAAALLAGHLDELAQTFKRDLALQLVMGEARIAWKTYSATLKAKVEQQPYGQLLGLRNVAAAFEGTVLRKALAFLLRLQAAMNGKHLDRFLADTFTKLSQVIDLLQAATNRD